MKRFAVILLVFVLVMTMSPAAFAEPAQVAFGTLEEINSGAAVSIAVELADGISVGFNSLAFHLYDHPASGMDSDFFAYGTLLNEESYISLVEAHVDDSERTDEDGYVVFTESDGKKTFVAPIAEELYLFFMVFPSVDADAIWALISWELEDYNLAEPVSTASGVIADAMDDSILVNVKLDLSYGWSAKFYPQAFYLCSSECQSEDEFDVYGTLLNAVSYASVVESHTADGTLEEKDGYLLYQSEGYKGIIAPVTEDEYITVLLYVPVDVDAVLARISYELF